METFQNFARAASSGWSQSGSGKDKDPETPKPKSRG
jgi:hypothetical protein